MFDGTFDGMFDRLFDGMFDGMFDGVVNCHRRRPSPTALAAVVHGVAAPLRAVLVHADVTQARFGAGPALGEVAVYRHTHRHVCRHVGRPAYSPVYRHVHGRTPPILIAGADRTEAAEAEPKPQAWCAHTPRAPVRVHVRMARESEAVDSAGPWLLVPCCMKVQRRRRRRRHGAWLRGWLHAWLHAWLQAWLRVCVHARVYVRGCARGCMRACIRLR